MNLSYDKYIVAFSGGKDSIALVLYLLDLGVDPCKIELWHHDIDGNDEAFMDWECTHDYCQKFADAFGLEIYFSWKEGGFKREMLRDNQRTAPTWFETPGKILKKVGGIAGKLATRLKFPQVAADLKVRWCSAYLKIDVCSIAIRNQERFNGLKTIVLSGERGEESTARSKYKIFEADRSDNRSGKLNRLVDRWRPLRDWKESEIWDIIRKYRVRVHPCYYMGWSRCSCKFCIFGNADQFASAYKISPIQGEEIMGYEERFGVTMKRNTDLRSLISCGNAYANITAELARQATSKIYDQQIIFNDNEEWVLPAGAYGESCGPQ
ncbi:3'-phosphoadenosine 5'-phosphosulfate sulfotransferase (PAPS reductase)/FAD synthetase [Sphingobacterium zeae]|uniref:3'-phosphoadenosine 5'-phosphosulfate sulfotransferase (PAPS reductase)/FAD synthetase n=1 Tax=Sphingobacterium zeae TaxID=1776859 RepID=A0ABU0U5P9_9SPHI|nr:phosphoadenosine phosphosulfate reductase family protein [Sphingobacterium zeae]MDQ1150174.1 3'-phosphoadenosine 5'-phosphosulfate sulfotransferase (PAPS reductase)/FAD synthetase [Sphingobacterium zeae]